MPAPELRPCPSSQPASGSPFPHRPHRVRVCFVRSSLRSARPRNRPRHGHEPPQNGASRPQQNHQPRQPGIPSPAIQSKPKHRANIRNICGKTTWAPRWRGLGCFLRSSVSQANVQMPFGGPRLLPGHQPAAAGLGCFDRGMRNGMAPRTTINGWFPLRGRLGSFPTRVIP